MNLLCLCLLICVYLNTIFKSFSFIAKKMNRDNYNNTKRLEAIPAGAVTGTVTGTQIDTQGYDAATFSVMADDTTEGTIKLQHSDTDGSGFEDCGSDDVLGTQGEDLVANTPVSLGYVGSKRYVKVIATITADSSAAGWVEYRFSDRGHYP